MKQNFNDEFKMMVVQLYRSGRPVKELSSEYGVSEVTIYKWIKKYSPIATIDEKEVTPNDLKQMQKEMLRSKRGERNLKKGYGHICEKINDAELFELMDEQKNVFPVTLLCEVLGVGVARSSFYQSHHKVESNLARENRALTQKIIQLKFSVRFIYRSFFGFFKHALPN